MRSGSSRHACLVIFLVAASLACQVIPTPPALNRTPRRPEPTAPALPQRSPTAIPPTTTTNPAASETASPGDLPSFPSQPGEPFASLAEPTLPVNEPQPDAQLPLPVPWDRVMNRAVADGLTEQQRDRLRRDGFVILHSQEPQFSDLRQRVAMRNGQPYYLTTDAAAYALRLTLDELLIAVEKEELRRRILAIIQATLAEVLSYLKLIPGGAMEDEARLAAAYLGVGLRLLDPQAPIDPIIAGLVDDQVDQILAGGGVEQAVLIPGFQDDFSAYRPPGHYAGDPDLAAYFRAMAWFSRVEWWIEAGETAPFSSRVPLILTLALRRARIQDPSLLLNPAESLSAAQEWVKVDAALSYFLGPDPDDGPAEYAALMDRVYGPRLTVVGLSDERSFELFQVYARELPPVQQGADPMAALIEAPGAHGWRFLGHGFRLDDYLLRQLAVTQIEDSARPSAGLALFSLLGSPAASTTLKASNASITPQASGPSSSLQRRVAGFRQELWMRSAPNAWLYALATLAAKNDPAAPAQLRTSDWAYKDLNSALGAWAGLRRGPRVDAATSIARQSTPQEGSLVSPPPPGYVEPNPEAFYRLSHLAKMAAEGLSQRGMTGVFAASPVPTGLKSLLLETLDLGDRLQRLGDIAAQELDGQPPAKKDWAVILAPLGPAEERAAPWPQPPAGHVPAGQVPAGHLPVGIAPARIAELGGPNAQSLQVANGWIDRLYALVPLEDGLYIAQGGVLTYYEVPVQGDRLLSDEEWARQLNSLPVPEPLLAAELYQPEGNPVDVLAMRVGDVYQVQPVAGRINLRAGPDRFSQSVQAMHPGDLFRIVDGPAQTGDTTWWRVQVPSGSAQPVEGWLVADPTWYARVW
ncbi:MAG: hypothetical protein A2W35_09410 [Chloroflexi bacterium RBG_16_57_11]|nr:MAG: hypothetical protein A2W35_09410 [Chloroflexi bacterium RBG_16_57_11]